MTSSESWKRTARIALVVILLVAFDLWSKDVVWGWFEGLKAAGLVDLDSHGHPRHPVLGGWLGVMTYPNYGAAFGQFDQIP
ncbi:MAG: lipoprotein signal peptidase, partial [Planctomycetota bacterium]